MQSNNNIRRNSISSYDINNKLLKNDNDISIFREMFHQEIISDLEETDTPAEVYAYNSNQNFISRIYYIDKWKKELESYKDKGWKQGYVHIDIKIDNQVWESILWYFQPLKEGIEIDESEINLSNSIIKHGRDIKYLNEKKYYEKTNFKCDPLALVLGYEIHGICYLRVAKRKNDRRTSMKRNRVYNVTQPINKRESVLDKIIK